MALKNESGVEVAEKSGGVYIVPSAEGNGFTNEIDRLAACGIVHGAMTALFAATNTQKDIPHE